jgi:hypothetical protein
MKEKEFYHLSPKAVLGQNGHKELLRYMNVLKKTWELPPNQVVAVMLTPGGDELVFCAVQEGKE